MKPFHGFNKSLLLELLISAIPLLFEQASSENKFEPKVVLYENIGGKGGSSFKSLAKNYPNLSSVNFDDKAQSACMIGTWLFYGDENYAHHDHGVSAQFRSNGACLNFQKLNKTISSFRFAGSPTDYRNDVLDLFSGILFTDIHLRTHSDIPDVSALGFPATASAIVHGKSKWTLYENTTYKGRSVCVAPQPNFIPTFYKNQLDFEIQSVMSVQKGCHASAGSSNIEVGTTTFAPTTPVYEIVHGEDGTTKKPKPNVGNKPTTNRPNKRPRPTSRPNGNHPLPGHHHPHLQ